MLESVTFSMQEAAEYLGVSIWLIGKLTREKKIPHIRLGKKVLYRKSTLDAFLEKEEQLSVT